jgi:hypothetical protein
MSEHISNSEILRLIDQWDQLKPTLRHGPGKLPPDIPAKVRFITRGESDTSAAALALMAANPGAVAPVKMVRFNPVTCDLLKTVGTRLSVAAQERKLDTAGIDAVATDPVAATPQEWAAADLTIGKLKIMAVAPDDFVSSAAKEFQRQQFRKAINDLAEQGRIAHERDLAEMRKQPGFAPMQADPQWKQLELDWRETVERYKQRRAKWHDKFHEDLSPEEQAEEKQLTNEQEREMQELRWRAYKLQQAYGVHAPDPLRTPEQLVRSIRAWQMWAETLSQPGDNQNAYATERAAEARKAALLLRLQYPSLASVPPPIADAIHDLGVLLDWAITANRDLSQSQSEQPKPSADTSTVSPMQTTTDSSIAAEISEFEDAWAAMWKAHSEQRSREIQGQTPTGMLERAEAVSRCQRACARLAQRARERGYDPRPLEVIAIDPTNPPLKEKEMAGGILHLLQAASGETKPGIEALDRGESAPGIDATNAGPGWHFMRPPSNRQGRYEPADYYFNDADAEIIREWIPDFDADQAKFSDLQTVLRTEFGMPFDESLALNVQQIIDCLSRRSKRARIGGSADYNEPRSESPESKKATHNADFTMVNWFGEEYTFALGVQSSALKALWEEWEKTGLGLHQDTIRNSIDAERDSFRMDTAFRKHPAFGRMIKKIGDGKYKLARWPGDTTPAPSKKKKSAGITSGARQKRV